MIYGKIYSQTSKRDCYNSSIQELIALPLAFPLLAVAMATSFPLPFSPT